MNGALCFRRMIELGVRNFEELIRILYQNPNLKETDVLTQRFQEEMTVCVLRKQVGNVVRNDISQSYQFLNTLNTDLLTRYQSILSFFKE